MAGKQIVARFPAFEVYSGFYLGAGLKKYLGRSTDKYDDIVGSIWQDALVDYKKLGVHEIGAVVERLEVHKKQFSEIYSPYQDRIVYAQRVISVIRQFSAAQGSDITLVKLFPRKEGAVWSNQYAYVTATEDLDDEGKAGGLSYSFFIRDEAVRKPSIDLFQLHEIDDFSGQLTVREVLQNIREEIDALKNVRAEYKTIIDWLGLRLACFSNILWQVEIYGRPLKWTEMSEITRAPVDPRVVEAADDILPLLENLFKTAPTKTQNYVSKILEAMNHLFRTHGLRHGDPFTSDKEVFQKVLNQIYGRDISSGPDKGATDASTRFKDRLRDFGIELGSFGYAEVEEANWQRRQSTEGQQ